MKLSQLSEHVISDELIGCLQSSSRQFINWGSVLGLPAGLLPDDSSDQVCMPSNKE